MAKRNKQKNLVIAALVIFLMNYIFTLTLNAANNKKYYRLKDLWTTSYDHIEPFDYNLDGIDELFIQHGKTQYDIVSYDLNYYIKSFTFSQYEQYDIIPILPSKKDEIYFLAYHSTADSVVYKILPPTDLTTGKAVSKSCLKDFYSFYRNKNTPPGIFHQSMGPKASFRNKAGENLTLFFYNTGWDSLGTRGLLAADVETQSIKWNKSIGVSIYNSQIDDIDNDGEIEIILGTYATQNGVKGSGISDDSSYVIVLEANGDLKWKRAIGPYWTGAWISVGDFLVDGEKDIIVYQYSRRTSIPNQDKIQLFDQ